ncbi:hypothetical protein [Amycolatopsis pigmentata]|uniref:PE family protein n=1 Tax=Amycolatopsis pigmentata TaxID=450801 RepID=A0ABW5FUW6_9PSEU
MADTLTNVPDPPPIRVGNNGPSGGYHFEPDQVQGVINKWQDLLVDLRSDVDWARTVATVGAPGKEFASAAFVSNGATPSGNTLLEQHKRMVIYVENYIKALQKASGQIQQTEQEVQQAAAQQGKEVM